MNVEAFATAASGEVHVLAAEAAASAPEPGCAASETAAAEPCGTVFADLVVFFALLLIRKHVVGFGDFLEFLLGCLVPGVQVRVVFAREFAVGLFNIRVGGVFFHAEGFIKVF